VATFLGCLLWNVVFLGIGYLLQGTGRSPVEAGFRIVLAMVIVEGAFLLLLRLKTSRRRRLDGESLVAR